LALRRNQFGIAAVSKYTRSSREVPRKSHGTCKEKALPNTVRDGTFARRKPRAEATKIILHKEWCKQKFVLQQLEKRLVFRATIKPAYQGRFSILLHRTMLHFVVPLRKGVVKT
jgi:hypothetical protein